MYVFLNSLVSNPASSFMNRLSVLMSDNLSVSNTSPLLANPQYYAGRYY